MKKTFLIIISVVLVLASAFGFYASYVGLQDIPGIQRSKNDQAADIEDAIDFIEYNLKDYNEMVALQKELDEAKAKTGDNPDGADAAGNTTAAATAPAAAKTSSPARTGLGKPQRSLATAAEINAAQVAYDSAQRKVSESQANLNAAQQAHNASQAAADSLGNSVYSASSAYSTYQAAKNEYDNTPSWMYSSKNSAKIAMDNANVNYQAALGGYSSIDEMQNAYNAASQQASADKAKVDQASATLANDQQALNNAKSRLDSLTGGSSPAQPTPVVNPGYVSNSNLNPGNNTNPGTNNNNNNNTNTNTNTNNGTKPQNNTGVGGILNNLNMPKSTDNQGISDEEAERLKKEIEDTADKLAKLKERGDVKGLVEDGIEILLENDEIAARVTDKNDFESVVKAAREYVEETTEKVNNELTTRQQLYFALRILSLLGAIAGLLGIIVAIAPKSFLFTMTLLMSIFTILCAIALNVYGYIGGYLNFVYTRSDGAGSGKLQLISMLAIMVSAVLSIIIVSVCRRAFKKALKKRKMRQHLVEETEKAERMRAEKAMSKPTTFDPFE